MVSKNIEVSVVFPCLNEEASVGKCVRVALEELRKSKINGEVVVCDNNSEDDSAAVAKAAGARVVFQKKRGYGNAYQKGLTLAKGKYLIMADSDLTYPLNRIDDFVKELRKGNEFVIGSRFKGKIMPGAMQPLHKYVGNPFLTGVLNLLFRAGVSDAHCGMRGFTKKAFLKMDLKSPGMEFASEMVIRAAQKNLKIKEIPIDYFAREEESKSKLSSFKDGWRHLKFMLELWGEKSAK